MAVRLIITIDVNPGKGAELATFFRALGEEVVREPGCRQYEMFQSLTNPDRLTVLELWEDQAALDAHAKLNATRPPPPSGVVSTAPQREAYTYSGT